MGPTSTKNSAASAVVSLTGSWSESGQKQIQENPIYILGQSAIITVYSCTLFFAQCLQNHDNKSEEAPWILLHGLCGQVLIQFKLELLERAIEHKQCQNQWEELCFKWKWKHLIQWYDALKAYRHFSAVICIKISSLFQKSWIWKLILR